VSILIRLKSDATLSKDFDRLLAEMRRYSHAKPRTTASIGMAKAIGRKLKIITNEMHRRASGKIAGIAVADSVLKEISTAAGGVSSAVSGAVNGAVYKTAALLALAGFALYQLKK